MSERIILQTSGNFEHAYRKRGTLQSWQENVARYAVGNSRLVLAISTAFATSLLYPTGSESGGFHFVGKSSSGKSTGLEVGASVWGGGERTRYVRSWRATSNGLESVAMGHCDTLLCLDEMGQVDAAEAGQTAYMLANGCGKSRAGRTGEGRAPAIWRLLFLSTGEIGLAEKLAEDGRGRKAAAGQQVRVVEIAADAGAGFGMFENLHGFPSGAAFSDHLKAMAAAHYGTAAREFLHAVAKALDSVPTTVAGYRKQFLAEHCPPDADGQIQRVAGRFALVAAAGEMATAFGVVPWPEGEATAAAAKCLAGWIDRRGGTGPAEECTAIATVRRFIEMHGTSRFEPMWIDGEQPASSDLRIINRAGFRRRDTATGAIDYLVLPEVWKSEICQGMDPVMVARLLEKQGLLVARGGKLQDLARLPGFSNPVRHYHLTAGILGGDE